MKGRTRSTGTPYPSQACTPRYSAETLLTAYGVAGRRGDDSVRGSSSGRTPPYISADPTMRMRGGRSMTRAASRTDSVPIAFTRNVSAGAIQDSPTWVSAARWYTAPGRASRIAVAIASKSVTSTFGATTSSPMSRRWSSSHPPTNPCAPVTSTRTYSKLPLPTAGNGPVDVGVRGRRRRPGVARRDGQAGGPPRLDFRASFEVRGQRVGQRGGIAGRDE